MKIELNLYKVLKLKIFKDFDLKLSNEEKNAILNAKTHYEVDRISRDILQPNCI